METQELLDRAIVKIKEKVLPVGFKPSQVKTATTRAIDLPPSYEQLYPALEVTDNERQDTDTKDKVEFIYKFLDEFKGDKSIHDLLIDILTNMAVISVGETKLGKVYKHCKLRRQGKSLIKEYSLVQRELEAL